MNNKDSHLLAEAYTLVLEAKKKLTAKQKELAAAAEPYDKITKADIITMAKKKSLKEDAAGIEDQEEEHCDAAEHGCDCDGCNECIANQKEEVKEEAPVPHTVNLNNGDTVSWKGSSYRVEDVMGGTFKLIPVS
jgi:hypothetical protein